MLAIEFIIKRTAVGGGGERKGLLVAGALRELSVGLCKGNHVLHMPSPGVVTRAITFMEGISIASSDVLYELTVFPV